MNTKKKKNVCCLLRKTPHTQKYILDMMGLKKMRMLSWWFWDKGQIHEKLKQR